MIDENPTTLEGAIKMLKELREDFDAHNHDGTSSRKFETLVVQTITGEVFSVRKTNYGDTQNGIWMGVVRNVVKFIIGNSTNLVSFDGTTLTIKGSIVGSSISIPDATTPLFSVDIAGNVFANSLQRRDFQWLTLFESLDGYSKTFVGAGTSVLGYQSFELTTGASNGDNCVVVKELTSAFSKFSWDKNKRIKFGINPVSGNGAFNSLLGTGDCSGGSGRHIGFFLSGINGSTYTLNASVANGSSTSTSSLGTYSYGTWIEIEARYYAGSRVEFYVNGTLILTITTTLPSGTTDAHRMLNIYLTSNGGGVQVMDVAYYDFWQSA